MTRADLFFRFCLLGPELCGLLLSVPIQSQVAGKLHHVESQALSHLNLAEKLADAKQYLQAISEYKLALQETPNDESALFGLAIAQAKAGQNPDAIQSYLTVLKVNPKLWEAEVNLGILLLSQQSTPEALTHFQNAQSINPKNFRVQYYTAKTQELTGDIAHAETSYLQALDLAQENSDRFEINASLGSLYLRKKSWPEAERHLLAARQLPGQTVTLDLDLAQLYYETGQPEKALDLLRSANKSDDPEIHELMGRILIAKKDNDQAIQSFELALKSQKDPERRRNLSLDLAQLYQQQGRTQDAISLVDTIAKSSDDPRIHFTLGTLHLHDRQFEPARQEFLRALQLKPDYVECYSNLGSVFLLEEKYPAAVEALGRFKALRPQVAGTYFYLGIAYDKLDDYPNAWAHYQKFLDLDQGKTDKQGFQARERMKVLEKKIKKR
jgi:tetratricopeptide (TPR) repeat protein